MPDLVLRGVSKTYAGPTPVEALKNVNLTIQQGEYVAIEGPSGAGKSTLLNLLALLDSPSTGDYQINSKSVVGLDDASRARVRSASFAFIFQSFHLLDGRSVIDNVALGGLYRDLPSARRHELGAESLAFVGLSHKAEQAVEKLSGGERQRVAIARAIASHAPIVVADEPTGNLDSVNGELVMETLERLNAQGDTVIIVTHDPELARRAPRRLRVYDGVVSEYVEDNPRRSVLVGSAAQSVEEAADVPVSHWVQLFPDTEDEIPSALLDQGPYPKDSLPPVEGTDSKVRLADALADVWKGLWTKPSRTMALVMAVALGVGLALTTAGLSSTASFQVSDIFDAGRNQRVALALPLDEADPARVTAVSQRSFERVRDVAGVVDLAIFGQHGSVPVTIRATTSPSENSDNKVDVYGMAEGHIPTTFTVETAGAALSALDDESVLVGSQLASQINLGPLLAGPSIWVQGEPKRVAGILTDAGLQISMLNGVIMTEASAARYSPIEFAGAEIRVQPGAGAQVAEQAPIAWNPTAPDQVQVEAPPDPASMREAIESNVSTMLITLTGVSLLAAALMLTNSMTTAVFQRIGEFGLRRAIGARRIHISALTLTESLIIGTIGGVLGTYLSFIGILVITIVRQWQPVFDPATIPIGVLGGILVGLLGGLVATQRSSKIEPSDALRT